MEHNFIWRRFATEKGSVALDKKELNNTVFEGIDVLKEAVAETLFPIHNCGF